MSAFLHGYLIGYLFWLSIAMGSVAVLQMHFLTGGEWGRAAKVVWESAAATILPLGLLFLPLAIWAGRIYPWAQGRAPGGYLSLPMFWLRAAAYFISWALMAWAVRRPERGGVAYAATRPTFAAGVGLVAYFLSMTFASVDWAMSLQPAWGSTAFGLIVIAGEGVAALSWGALALGAVEVDKKALNDLGNLMLAFVMLWAYVSFSQFLVIWQGDIPDEVKWYVGREHGAWAGVALTLVIVQFAAPFILLLWRSVKRTGRVLAGVALALLVGRWLDLWWLVAPAYSPDAVAGGWMSLLGLLVVGAPWVFLFRREHRRRLAWEAP